MKKFILIVIAVLLLIILFGPRSSNNNTENSNKNQTSTIEPKESQASVDTITNQPEEKTSAPTNTPISTPTPDSKNLSGLELAQYIANQIESSTLTTRMVDFGDGMLYLEFTLSNYWNEEYAFIYMAEATLSACRLAKENDSVDMVNILFYSNVRDSYGNTSETLVSSFLYERDTILKINYDYFETAIYSSPKALFDLSYSSFIHNLLKPHIF